MSLTGWLCPWAWVWAWACTRRATAYRTILLIWGLLTTASILILLPAVVWAASTSATSAKTFNDAVQLTLANDPNVKLAQYAYESAQIRYQRSQASILLDGTTSARLQAESDLQQAKLTYQQDMNNAIISLTQAAFTWRMQVLERQIAQDQLTRAQMRLAVVQDQARAGGAQALDELMARSDVAHAQVNLTKAKSALAEAEDDLRRHMGSPAGAPITITDLPSFPEHQIDAQALADAEEASAVLTQKTTAVRLAQLDLDQLRAIGAATLDLRQAENNLAVAQAQLDQAKADLAARLRSAQAVLDQSKDQYAAADAALALAQQKYEIVRQQTDAGLKTDLDLLGEQINLMQSELGRMTALRNYVKAFLDLRSLLGASLVLHMRTAPPDETDRQP